MAHNFIPGITSQSLGNPQHHGIEKKLQAVQAAGLQSVEIFFEDIEQLAKACEAQSTKSRLSAFESAPAGTTLSHTSQHEEVQLACAKQIQQWCLEAGGLQVICLQPFGQYEGTLDPDQRSTSIQKLELWIQIAKNLGTDLIQVPSNFLPAEQCTGDRAQIVEDLRRIAQIGATQTPPIRFAHEALCFGTHTDTWEAAWQVVEAVNMDNFGTCLDTFNILGRIYADPARDSGVNLDAHFAVEMSIRKLKKVFSNPKNLKKVFYVELCDGERIDEPISPQHPWYDPEQPPRMTWSRNARLYPFETDAEEAVTQGRDVGYLPILRILDTLLDLGYEGHLSFEVFNRSLNQPGPNVVAEHTARARTSWQRCATYIDQFFQTRDTKCKTTEISNRASALNGPEKLCFGTYKPATSTILAC